MLSLDVVDYAVIVAVGRIVCRLGTQETQVQLDVDRISSDAQVLKAAAQKRDGGNVALGRMVGTDLRHNAVCSHDIENVQVFDHRGGESNPAMAGFVVVVSGNMSVGGAERNHPLKAEVLVLLTKIAALCIRNFGIGYRFNFLLNREVHLPTE